MAIEFDKIIGEHVLSAANKIESGDYQSFPSTAYDVIINGKAYPPKEILRIAYKLATGNEIGKIYGGESTNKHLRKLGFEIKIKKET